MAAWEGFAQDALHAWERRERAPIDVALDARGLNGVNADALEAAAKRTPAQRRNGYERTHAALVAAVRAVPADRWATPPFTRGRPLGLRLGSILNTAAGQTSRIETAAVLEAARERTGKSAKRNGWKKERRLATYSRLRSMR